MAGLLDMYFPAEDPMDPAALFPQGLLGPSVLSRMQQHSSAQRARMAGGDYSPSRMDEDAMWLADDVAGGLLGTLGAVSKADDIARLLREGRAAEVTDEMLGALGPNDQAKLFELYESGATGMPMSMDEGSRMARAQEMGHSPGWYHGSTFGGIETFGGATHNPEGHFGMGHYFTSAPKDASANYAGLGPDLTGRVELRAERIASELGLDYDDPLAMAQASKELVGDSEGVIYPTTVRGSIVDTRNHTRGTPTTLEMEMPSAEQFMDDARAELGADADKWDIYDRAQELADDAWSHTEPSGPLADFIASIRRQADEYGFDADEALSPIMDDLADGVIDASALDAKMRKSEGLMYAEDESGNLIGNDILRQAFVDAGYDNILMDAQSSFPSMKNIPPKTQHLIASDPANIRSVHARFDPRLINNRNLLAGIGGAAGLGLLAGTQYPYQEPAP